MEKRSGQSHSINNVLPQEQPGPLLVWCPACPQPFFNMDPNWKDVEPLHRSIRYVMLLRYAKFDVIFRHVHRLFIANDGNFHQQSKSKNGDPNDMSLTRGRGTFPVEGPFKDYLAKAGDSVEVCCSSHHQFLFCTNDVHLEINLHAPEGR